ncbi:MAG: cytochrome P450, partial [Pseudonocardia sp.]|nr:cytochrome P450 [Pseudonocardia sp.]
MTSCPGTSTASVEPIPLFLPLLRDRLDPVAELGALRAARPVARLDVPDDMPAVWLVTGYEEVRRVLGDSETFSNDLARLAGTGLENLAAQDPGGLGFTDPPDHTRLRRLLTPEFTAHRLHALRPRIDAVVGSTIDVLEVQGPPADFVTDFAVPIPSLVICDLLGVPEEDRAGLERRGAERFDVLGSMEDSLTAVRASLDYLTELVTRYRTDPQPGLLATLLRRHGDDLADRELAELADGLLIGGHETTASMLALGALTLLEKPLLADGLRSGDIPVGPFVEELLRVLSVVQVAFPRFARQATELGTERVGAGDVVLCSLTAANRDPAFVDQTDHGNATRQPAPHLAFGHGIHRCIGAELGRMELRAALPTLL